MMDSISTRRLSSTFVVCLLTITLPASTNGNSYCSVENPQAGEPVMPKLDDSYSTQLIGKHIHSKEIEIIHENYDKDKKKYDYDVMIKGVTFCHIIDLARNTMLYSKGEKCQRIHLDTENIGKYGVRSVGIMLGMGKATVWKYKGEDKIRGIKVQKWQTCGSIKSLNFTAEYSFTKADQIPYRIEIKGIQSGNIKNLHIIYDYFLFKKGTPENDWRPMPGVVCAYASNKETPDIAESATFRMDITEPSKKKITGVRVHFDKEKGVMRQEYEDEIHINDYERGIQFVINKEKEDCSRKPISRFAGPEETVDENGLIHMASLKHFLFDDGVFTYNGVYRARGIECDVYTKKSQAAEKYGVRIIELYIARKGINMTNDEGRIEDVVQAPVRVVMRDGGDYRHMQIKRQYDIYDFDPQEFPYNDPFDLTPCYNERETVTFEMTFNGKIPDREILEEVLAEDLTDIISEALEISILRVRIRSFLVQDETAQVSGVIFDNETPFYLYQEVRNMKVDEKLRYDDYTTYENKSNTPTLCADLCSHPYDKRIKFGKICTAFEFDRETKECIFYTYDLYLPSKKEEILVDSNGIDFYRQTALSHEEFQTAEECWADLEGMVSDGLINVTDDAGTVFKATSVERIMVEEEGEEDEDDLSDYYSNTSPIKQFIMEEEGLSAQPVELLHKMTLGACARHCLTVLKYSCEAFEYKDTFPTECKFFDSLSVRDELEFEPEEEEEQEREELFTYTRNYFSQFDRVPGKSVLSHESDTIYTGLVNENSCAELCVKEDTFYCQSFEVCKGTCVIGRKHIFNVPPANVEDDYDCDHYSRDYIQDYTRNKNQKTLSNSNVIERKDIGIKECATLCSTYYDYDCDVFEFCDTDSICRITTKSLTHNKLKYTDSGSCDLYRRHASRQRFGYSAYTSSDSNSSSDGGHSPGSMGAVALGMIVLGMIFMIVIVLVFFNFRSPSGGPDGMSIGFTRRQLEEDC